MMSNRALLTNFVENFLGTVCFGNNDFAVIVGYEDVVIGSMMTKKGYYVEDGVDFITGDRSLNLYTIALNEVASNSSTCLLAKASSQSWLWHQRLSHLNFTTINNLVKNNLVQDEASEVIISFIKKTQVNIQLHVQRVRKDNGTEFKNKNLAKFFDEVGIIQQLFAARTPQQNGVVERWNKTLVKAARTMLTFANLPLFLWDEAIATACFTQNRSIIHKHFDKTPYELMNKRKPNIKFFRVFGCRCYLLNDYDDVGKLKEKGDIGVFVGYSKEFASFSIYNKQTRKIHESVNVNSDAISDMASKQFSLEPDLSNLNEMGKFSNPTVSQKKFFHESSESFQEETSSSSLNDDVHQRLQEVVVPSSNTQSISKDMIPNVDEASTSHNVFNERLEEAYIDATLRDADWVSAMQDELDQFARLKVWRLITRPEGKTVIKTKWVFKNKKDENSLVIQNKARLIATVFLNRILKEEVYVGQPLGFVSKKYLDHVYALDKALYGLKQAPQAWYNVLSQFLIDSGFQKDADHAGCNLDRKAESEYVVVSSCCAQVLWMRTQLTDYGFFFDKVQIYCDSKSAITILCNPVQHTRTKHIDVRFSDADYAGCKDSFKSTSGGAQFLGEKLVSWSSKKQDCMALLTAEEEYVSLSACCAQVLWMRTQLTDYDFHFDKILIYCDLKSAIAISCNPVQHLRTKHIVVRYHFIKEHVEKGTIELYFVKTNYQLADIFTKALPADCFNYLVHRLGMRSLSSKEIERLAKS
nr:retrovirus-related Pol polyprotein from transposon TNT 1-94 [Tanacetum cinerariifolium]